MPTLRPSADPPVLETLSSCDTSLPSALNASTSRAARDAAIFGAHPKELVNDLLLLLSGVVLDAADALEVSLHQLGMRPECATPAVNAVVDVFRARFAQHGACLRQYALRNVFAVPDKATAAQVLASAPANTTADREFRAELARINRQIANSAQRHADAVAHRKSIDAHQRGMQQRITELEDICARVEVKSAEEFEACVRALNAANAATVRDLTLSHYALEDHASNMAHERGKNSMQISTDDDVAMLEAEEKLGNAVSLFDADEQDAIKKPSVLKDTGMAAQSPETNIKEIESFASRLRRLH